MFDIGWSELLVIAVVALIAIGPKELPGALRSLGYWMGKIRGMAAEFQGQFREAMREAEMADLKKTADELNETARSVASTLTSTYDPMEFAKEADYVPKPVEPAGTSSVAETPPVAAPAEQIAAASTSVEAAAESAPQSGEPAVTADSTPSAAASSDATVDVAAMPEAAPAKGGA